MHKQMEFKKINIQNLQKRPQPSTKVRSQDQIIEKMNENFKWSDYPCLCYQDTAISQERIMTDNGLFRVNFFFDAFYQAYIKHGDIVLVPDEIWIMILFYLSTYIDENAEKLRKKLVLHQGVKTLLVTEVVADPKESILQQKNWDYFFDQIIKQIEKNTVSGVVEALACDFSTTTKVYKTISTAIIMSSLKKYFQYHRMLAGCGINNAYMAGTRQDWVKLIQKLQKCSKFDVDGKIKTYIQHMKVILKNFLMTYDGNPDKAWWNTVMTTPQKRQVYGGNQLQIQGWILNFFGMYEKTVFDGFPQYTIKVPIKLINQLTKTQKSLILVSDWVSVSKLNETAYKPDVGMCIFTIKQSPIKENRVQKDIDEYKKKMLVNKNQMKLKKIPIMLPIESIKKVDKMRGKTAPKNFIGQAKNAKLINNLGII